MAHVVVLGAGLGGAIMAYELRDQLRPEDRVTVVTKDPKYHFVPSNPWIAVGWRHRDDITVDLAPTMARKGIGCIPVAAERLDPDESRIALVDGQWVAYDYLVIATGPEGPVIVGAAQGASCFGPAYEFLFILETALRRAKVRDRVPMTFVTPGPYIGHLGLDGVGDTKGLLERQMRENPKYPNIFAVDVCVAIPPMGPTPVPCGVPKTGFMIESMVTATAHNIGALVRGREPREIGSWNAVCLADFGDGGIAFVAQPQIPPRNVNWSSSGRWVHLAKAGFKKYAEILEGFGGTPEQAARAVALLKSLSHEGRLQILCLLVDGEMNVTQLAGALGSSPVSVSQQLMRLRAEGIVQTRREGRSVIYHLARAEVSAIVTALRDTFCKRH